MGPCRGYSLKQGASRVADRLPPPCLQGLIVGSPPSGLRPAVGESECVAKASVSFQILYAISHQNFDFRKFLT